MVNLTIAVFSYEKLCIHKQPFLNENAVFALF